MQPIRAPCVKRIVRHGYVCILRLSASDDECGSAAFSSVEFSGCPRISVGVPESRGGCPRISRESRECPARANAPLVGVPECLRMSANLWVSQNLAVHPVQWVSPVHRCPRFSECPRFAPRFSGCPRFIVRAGSRGSVGVPELRPPNCARIASPHRGSGIRSRNRRTSGSASIPPELAMSFQTQCVVSSMSTPYRAPFARVTMSTKRQSGSRRTPAARVSGSPMRGSQLSKSDQWPYR